MRGDLLDLEDTVLALPEKTRNVERVRSRGSTESFVCRVLRRSETVVFRLNMIQETGCQALFVSVLEKETLSEKDCIFCRRACHLSGAEGNSFYVRLVRAASCVRNPIRDLHNISVSQIRVLRLVFEEVQTKVIDYPSVDTLRATPDVVSSFGLIAGCV